MSGSLVMKLQAAVGHLTWMRELNAGPQQERQTRSVASHLFSTLSDIFDPPGTLSWNTSWVFSGARPRSLPNAETMHLLPSVSPFLQSQHQLEVGGLYSTISEVRNLVRTIHIGKVRWFIQHHVRSPESHQNHPYRAWMRFSECMLRFCPGEGQLSCLQLPFFLPFFPPPPLMKSSLTPESLCNRGWP